jgi:hypothetical protein
VIPGEIQRLTPIPLLGGARGGFINYFFILIAKTENHFGLSIICFVIIISGEDDSSRNL